LTQKGGKRFHRPRVRNRVFEEGGQERRTGKMQGEIMKQCSPQISDAGGGKSIHLMGKTDFQQAGEREKNLRRGKKRKLLKKIANLHIRTSCIGRGFNGKQRRRTQRNGAKQGTRRLS